MTNTDPLTLAPIWHPLNWIDEYLQARGWQCEAGKGWLPPQAFADAIAVQYGRGHFRRATAIQMQVTLDESLEVHHDD